MKVLNRKKVFWSTVLLVAGFGVATQATPIEYHFDLETASAYTTEIGYTHVDHTTAYSAISGYGITGTPSASKPSADRTAPDALRRDFVRLSTTVGFRVDVPNGSYKLRLIGGDNSNAIWEGFRLSGDGGTSELLIGRYALPDEITTGNPRPYTYSYADPPAEITTWPRVPTLPDMFVVPAGQFMLGHEIPLTVTSGFITIRGMGTADGERSALNAFEVWQVPEPATIVLLVMGTLGLMRRR